MADTSLRAQSEGDTHFIAGTSHMARPNVRDPDKM